MEVNLPVWGYYPRNDKPFIDPLYAPYQSSYVSTEVGMENDVSHSYPGVPSSCQTEQVCPVNTWAQQGYPDGFVNPALVRKGWGMSFQLMHPDKDPCPEGWNKEKDGWCHENKPDFGDHGLYSNNAFVPKYQYWASYAPRLVDPRVKQIDEFDQKSVSPWTGNYVIYSNPKPASNRAIYGSLPSKDSMLA